MVSLYPGRTPYWSGLDLFSLNPGTSHTCFVSRFSFASVRLSTLLVARYSPCATLFASSPVLSRLTVGQGIFPTDNPVGACAFHGDLPVAGATFLRALATLASER